MKELKDCVELSSIKHLKIIQDASELQDVNDGTCRPHKFYRLDSTAVRIHVHFEENDDTPHFVSMSPDLYTVMVYLASVDRIYTKLLEENFDKVINFLDMMDN